MDIRWKNNRDFEDLKDLVMHRESETWEDFIQSRKNEGRIKRTILLGQRIVELRNQAWIILFNRIRNLWEIGEILFDGKIILSFKKTLSKYYDIRYLLYRIKSDPCSISINYFYNKTIKRLNTIKHLLARRFFLVIESFNNAN